MRSVYGKVREMKISIYERRFNKQTFGRIMSQFRTVNYKGGKETNY